MRVLLSVLLTAFFGSTTFTVTPSFKDDAIRASFDEYISKYFQSYKTNKREKVSKLGGGWAKESFEATGKFTVKAEKKNIFVCEFELKKSRTKYRDLRQDAEKDTQFIDATIVKHRHKYEFNQTKWVVKGRQHFNPWLGEWFDCNEKIEEGENKRSINIEGCFEEQ